VVDYSHTDKVTPSKVFAPPAVIQPLTSLGCGKRPRRIPREISIKVPLPDSCLYSA
jgi:hypothetical protein